MQTTTISSGLDAWELLCEWEAEREREGGWEKKHNNLRNWWKFRPLDLIMSGAFLSFGKAYTIAKYACSVCRTRSSEIGYHSSRTMRNRITEKRKKQHKQFYGKMREKEKNSKRMWFTWIAIICFIQCSFCCCLLFSGWTYTQGTFWLNEIYETIT